MINGDPHEFLDHIYSGQDTPYRFENVFGMLKRK